MLYVFHGTDTSAALKKVRTLIDSLRTKRPDASYVSVDADHWSSSIIDEHAGGQGLFSKAYIIFFDRVAENDEAAAALADRASLMRESVKIFIVLEGKLNTGPKKAFEKSANKTVEVNTSENQQAGRSREFNIFALADAIGERDSFRAWTIYRQAVDAGMGTESIVGTIFWQLKSMMVAMAGKSAGETGLSPFVYTKAKRAAEKYSAQEMERLMQRFIILYHDGHRGVADMELGVERVLLGI